MDKLPVWIEIWRIPEALPATSDDGLRLQGEL
jgi:hypothetical protein